MNIYTYAPQDFLIHISPLLDKDKNWVGELDVSLALNPSTPLNAQDFQEIYEIVKLMSVSLSLFEEFSHVKELAEWSLKSQEKVLGKNIPSTKEELIIDSEENVITVDFRNPKKNYDA
tara:strand:- start:994 stop:1347 length:354 start_codon:yes stop_codon:yes gene_type:complete